jgi:hypothetical protein
MNLWCPLCRAFRSSRPSSCCRLPWASVSVSMPSTYSPSTIMAKYNVHCNCLFPFRYYERARAKDASIRRVLSNEVEESRLLGYKNPVRTSQETHYVSATESSQLMLYKIWGFHGGDYEECRLLWCYAVWLLQQPTFQRNLALPSAILTVVTIVTTVTANVVPSSSMR